MLTTPHAICHKSTQLLKHLLVCQTRPRTRIDRSALGSQKLNLLIHHRQIIIIVISHRIAWCFGGGQGVWLGFAFVPTFELIGFAVCLIGIWQGATLFKVYASLLITVRFPCVNPDGGVIFVRYY